jgi:glycogen operon protein
MILAGDEVLRTQRGNNNAYCQDNEISWFDWRLSDTSRNMLRFTRGMIALRRRHPSLHRRRFLTGRRATGAESPDVVWHGERLNAPGWSDGGGRLLAYTLAGTEADEMPLHVILNMSDQTRAVDLPALSRHAWRRAADTALACPQDITLPDQSGVGVSDQYIAEPRSVVVLEARAV